MSSPPSDNNHHHAAKSKVRLTPFIQAAQRRQEFSGSLWAEKLPLKQQQQKVLFFFPDVLTFCSDFVKLRLWKHFLEI